ncbi:hypothetical protein ACFC5T_40095 [Streptomyces sp. NPDC055961]|uniref:hypothetical protein n=1 Tax=Streptomyces sp. NPDC055961 TaxID=3345666 RepID=UPI0035D5FB9E
MNKAIPLEYAADVLADHDSYVKHSGVPDPTDSERWIWAAEDLADWENTVVRMDWPGDDAFDAERWDQDAYWQLREQVLHDFGLAESPETTGELLRRYCQDRIDQCRRLADHNPAISEERN